MNTLIIGAGPLGSLYAYLFHKAGINVTLLARDEHYKFLNEYGLTLINEFTNDKIIERVKIADELNVNDKYDLVIVAMRKNSVKKIIPFLGKAENLKNILFLGNNASGFKEYMEFIPTQKILFGFPGGGGSKVDHIVHYIDSEKPYGKRFPVVIGEMDGKLKDRTKEIIGLFESADIPVKFIDDINGWLKYHAVFVIPIAGAMLKAGDNYKLAVNDELIRKYIRAVKEGGDFLKKLGFNKSFNPKFNLIKMMPENLTIRILKKVFDSKFAEVAMMMHVNAAGDEMIELGNELLELRDKTDIKTPNLEELINYISLN